MIIKKPLDERRQWLVDLEQKRGDISLLKDEIRAQWEANKKGAA